MILNELFVEKAVLVELRRNPERNIKSHVLEELEKYRGQPDVFVSYTSDVGSRSHQYNGETRMGIKARGYNHNMRGSKLGLNPKSTYDTPLGIYAYPLNYVLEKKGFVDFAGDEPYLQIFRPRDYSKLLILNSYTLHDQFEDVEKIRAIVGEEIDIENAERNALVDTTGGRFWNVTRLASIEMANDKQKSTVQWNKLFRQLGYDGVVDNGEGIIHSNEPTQAVFFSIKSIEILETVHNVRPYRNRANLLADRPGLFKHWLYDGSITYSEICDYFSMLGYVREIEWDKIPKHTQKLFYDNLMDLFNQIKYKRALFDLIPLTPEQIISIISKKPPLILFIDFEKEDTERVIIKYIVNNFKLFLYTFSTWPSATDRILFLSNELITIAEQDIGYLSALFPKETSRIMETRFIEYLINRDPDLFFRYADFRTYLNMYKTIHPRYAIKLLRWLLTHEGKPISNISGDSHAADPFDEVMSFWMMKNRPAFYACIRVYPLDRLVDVNLFNIKDEEFVNAIHKLRPELAEANHEAIQQRIAGTRPLLNQERY